MNRRLSAVVVLGLALIASGCGWTAPSTPSPPSGRPQRIISLAPSVTEILFALGAGRQMAACTRLCNYPPEARRLPRIGDMHIDLEAVVGLAPDLIVAESITPEEIVRRLQALGLPVLQVDSSTLEGYMTTLKVLGQATGHQEEARRLQESLAAKLASLRATRGRIPLRQRPRVFVEIWGRPLQTAGGGTFIDEMVRVAGGSNIFHDVSGYPQVSPEALVARDPEVVLLTTSSVDDFLGFEAFRALSAARAKAVLAIDPDTFVRPSPRLGQGLDALVGAFQR
jgi:iron complex transport system substrate-binding protein